VGSVFLIETPTGSGSGWLIEPGLILTNQHVVAGYLNITVRQTLNPPFTARVLAVDSRKDIALLRFDPARAQLPLRAAPLPLGSISTRDIARSLLALGYSGSGVKGDGTVGSAAANVGVLSQIIDFGAHEFGSNLVMDVPTDPGDSGGPVLNGDGFVVGMVRAVQQRTSGGQRVVGTFYAVHVDELRAALPSLRQGISR
jgi:S1-C subfamily serine protease